MKIILKNNNECTCEIMVKPEDYDKERDEKFFDIAAMAMRVCHEYVRKMMAPRSMEEERDTIKAILKTSIAITDSFYKDMSEDKEAYEDQAEEERLYAFMEETYADFLKKSKYTEEYILNALRDQDTDLDVAVIDEEKLCFCIVEQKSRAILIELGSQPIESFDEEEMNYPAVAAHAAAIIAYDKAVGQDNEKNSARKYTPACFEDKVREMLAAGD